MGVEQNIPGVGAIHGPKDVVEELEGTSDLLSNDEHLNRFVKGWDAHRALEGLCDDTALFSIGFSMRNASGNVFNSVGQSRRPMPGLGVPLGAEDAERRGARTPRRTPHAPLRQGPGDRRRRPQR